MLSRSRLAIKRNIATSNRQKINIKYCLSIPITLASFLTSIGPPIRFSDKTPAMKYMIGHCRYIPGTVPGAGDHRTNRQRTAQRSAESARAHLAHSMEKEVAA